MKKDIQKKDFTDDTESIIKRTLTNLGTGLSGLATSDKKDIILSVGYIFQRMMAGQFLSSFSEEWRHYCEKGRIKDDYHTTAQHNTCLQELLDCLDKDSPDEIRFSVLKQIFLNAATETKSDRNSVLPQQYMCLARSLTSGEILVLRAAYQIVKKKEVNLTKAKHNIVFSQDLIANESGLRTRELVKIHEIGLIDKRFFISHKMKIPSDILINKEHFCLTDLGWDFCKFLDTPDTNDSAPSPG